uniref:Uncharacterized protein n=1 Tax=Anguilla anguilla TaxID=7936 RepID=A0A0E9TWH9_ANGAN
MYTLIIGLLFNFNNPTIEHISEGRK